MVGLAVGGAAAVGAVGPSPDLPAIVAVLQADPTNVGALNAYGIEQARAGDLIGAIRTWRYAIDLAPRYVHLYNNIGSALRRLGHLKEAREWYQASLRLQPTYWTWYNLGLLQEEMGRTTEAMQAYWEAVRLFPAFMAARERYLRLERLAREAPPARPTAPASPTAPSPVAKPPVPILAEAEPSLRPQGGEDDRSGDRPETPTPSAGGATSVSPSPGDRVPRAPSERVAGATAERAKRPAAERASTAGPLEESLTAETPAREYDVVRLPGDSGGQVFLTFDGGADADGLEPILAALAARGVRSTFFLTGQWVKRYPELARRILASGHEIANHSMSHQNMANWSKEAIAAELEKAEQVFVAVLGRRGAPFFRFPFGAQNRRVEQFTEELGYRPVYWHIDTLDWKEPSVDSIVDKVASRIRRGAVVLMHVGSRNGAKALPTILDHLLVRGYRPDRLSALDPAQIAALPTIGRHR
ncbi:MAG: putative polysaccharide deacetylase [Candidatus Ozemobacter sibiricus]|uniref:Putative polysaccharide deacetylase n=1 Tax=Candidatus Ozemobacter sibiricus TaxID=2268124 RepID=A0A367ZMA2_9BACT|nr:MAG: putative polysaccharide deacetylase [Candidatus Ozemobacter sibiricus]